MGAHESTVAHANNIQLLTNALQSQKENHEHQHYFDSDFFCRNYTTYSDDDIERAEIDNNTTGILRTQKPSRRQYTTTIFFLRPPRDLLLASCQEENRNQCQKPNDEIFVDVINNNDNSSQVCHFYKINDRDSIKSLKIFNNQSERNSISITELDHESNILNNQSKSIIEELVYDEKECEERKELSHSSYSDQIVFSSSTSLTPISYNDIKDNQENTETTIINRKNILPLDCATTVSYTVNDNKQFTITYDNNITTKELTDLKTNQAHYQKTQFLEQLIKSFSKVAVKRRRRASVSDENDNYQVVSSQSSPYHQNYLKFRVPTIIPSPRSIMSR